MRHVVIGTAGHIDHGKSTLVQALTGIDPDRLEEEKARGITIDLGFAHSVAGDVTLAFVDVPGHERFVKNMLAGATGIDVLLLVVAADESVMPQTREHFDICRLLGVRRGVVAMTKADLADADTLEIATLEVRELVAGSFLAEAPIVPVSATTGAGLERLRAALREAAEGRPARRADGAFRLPIDRVFSVRGFGTVVTGTVVAGRASVDDTLELLPSARAVKVRALQGHGETLPSVGAGQRAAVNLAGVDVAGITRGDTLAAPGRLLPTQRFDARLEMLPTARALRHGGRVRFHQGTGETLGRVAISSVRASADAADALPAAIPPGSHAHVRLRVEKPVVLTRGDRFVLRAYSPPVTIAGGVVIDPHPARSALRTAAARRRFQSLDTGDPDGPASAAAADHVVQFFAEERGARGLARAALAWRAGLTPSEADATIGRLAAAGAIVVLGDLLVAATELDGLAAAVRDLLGSYHRSQPLSEGMPREEVRERLFARAHPAVFERVLKRLLDGGVIAGRDRLALASHRVTLSDEDETVRQRIERAFRDAALRPPDVATLAADAGLPGDAVQRALTLLQRQKVLVRVDALWFHASALDDLKRMVRSAKEEETAQEAVMVDVAWFKNRFDVSRKFAIPLLEYLDRERVTRRIGNARVVL